MFRVPIGSHETIGEMHGMGAELLISGTAKIMQCDSTGLAIPDWQSAWFLALFLLLDASSSAAACFVWPVAGGWC
jgi:hypothetical protein